MKKYVSVLLVVLAALSLSCGASKEPAVDEFSIVLVSDIHVPTYTFPINQPLDDATLDGMHNQKRIAQFVKECPGLDPRPAFVMNLGDTGDLGWTVLLKYYVRKMQTLVDQGIPVYTVVGNHDLDYAGIAADDLAELFDPLGPALINRHGTRYSFDYGGCHFVVINNRPVTGLIRLNPEEFAWLENDLSSVDRDTRVLLFMHANMPVDDTHRVVELLQTFSSPMIIHGHGHCAGSNMWGGIPVVTVGSLYGGTPEAGSYSVMTVTPDSISVRIRDFADTAVTFGEPYTVPLPIHTPELAVVTPQNGTVSGNTVAIALETPGSDAGTAEYRFDGAREWTPLTKSGSQWETDTALPEEPGRHLLSLRFTDSNGAVILAHRILTVPSETVRKAWTTQLKHACLGRAAIWNDRAIIPTVEGGVYALSLDDGSILWNTAVDDGQIIGGIAISGDTVCYAAGHTVYGCAASTGEMLWQTDIDATVVSALESASGNVFVPSGEGLLYCLDAGDGSIHWKHESPLPIMMQPASDGERVYFGNMDGRIRALDISDGREVWSDAVSAPEDKYTTAAFWPPVVTGNTVIINKIALDGDDHNIAAYSASNGRKLWSKHLDGGQYRLALNETGDRLYAYLRDDSGTGAQCLSVADGRIRWKQTQCPSLNAALVEDGTVIVRNIYSVSALDASSGKVHWTYRTTTGPQGSYYGPKAMAVKGRLVVVGTAAGHVTALRW